MVSPATEDLHSPSSLCSLNDVRAEPLSDKKIERVVLKTFNTISVTQLENQDQEKRLKYLIDKCVKKLKMSSYLQNPSQEPNIEERIQYLVKTSSSISKSTLDCLFLPEDCMEEIDDLGTREKSGYVVYVTKLCEAEIEAIRGHLKELSKEPIKEAIKTTLNDKTVVAKIVKDDLTPQQKFEHLVHSSFYTLLNPYQLSLRGKLDELKTQTFSREELEKKNLPGSRNMIPDLIERRVVNKEIYKILHREIFEQDLKKEVDRLHQGIEKMIKASPTLNKKFGLEI